MKFSIVANPKQPNMKKILTTVIGFLEDFDLEEESAKIVGLKGNPIDQLKGEMVISLGGDGTLLYILDTLNKPVFVINCGGVGVLTEIEHSEDMFSSFKRLESKNYKLQRLGRVDAFINNLAVPQPKSNKLPPSMSFLFTVSIFGRILLTTKVCNPSVIVPISYEKS